MAKELLFNSVVDIDMGGLPRCVPRRKSDDKANLEVDNIFGIIDYMDEQNALSKLPLFVAKNLQRLPPFKADILDLCLAVKRINAPEEKVKAASMHDPDPPTVSDVKSDKRVAALEDKFDLIVRHLGISGSKDNSTTENTSSTTVMGSLVSFATGPVSRIDASGSSGTDVNWPPLFKATTDVGAGSGSERARVSAALADSQLGAKQDASTTVQRLTRRVLRGSRRDDDSSGSMKVQPVARRLTAFVG